MTLVSNALSEPSMSDSCGGDSRLDGLFRSPYDGVVWDSERHCWVALPLDYSGGAPEVSNCFAPEELGMEGAKAEAIKRRRSFEEARLEELEGVSDDTVDCTCGLPAPRASVASLNPSPPLALQCVVSVTGTPGTPAAIPTPSTPGVGALAGSSTASSSPRPVSAKRGRGPAVVAGTPPAGGVVGQPAAQEGSSTGVLVATSCGSTSARGGAAPSSSRLSFKRGPREVLAGAAVTGARHVAAGGTRSPARSRGNAAAQPASSTSPRRRTEGTARGSSVSPRNVREGGTSPARHSQVGGGSAAKKVGGGAPRGRTPPDRASRLPDRRPAPEAAQRRPEKLRQEQGDVELQAPKNVCVVATAQPTPTTLEDRPRQDITHEVLAKVLNLETQVREMQEENKRERTEKEALREDNLRLKQRLEELCNELAQRSHRSFSYPPGQANGSDSNTALDTSNVSSEEAASTSLRAPASWNSYPAPPGPPKVKDVSPSPRFGRNSVVTDRERSAPDRFGSGGSAILPLATTISSQTLPSGVRPLAATGRSNSVGASADLAVNTPVAEVATAGSAGTSTTASGMSSRGGISVPHLHSASLGHSADLSPKRRPPLAVTVGSSLTAPTGGPPVRHQQPQQQPAPMQQYPQHTQNLPLQHQQPQPPVPMQPQHYQHVLLSPTGAAPAWPTQTGLPPVAVPVERFAARATCRTPYQAREPRGSSPVPIGGSVVPPAAPTAVMTATRTPAILQAGAFRGKPSS